MILILNRHGLFFLLIVVTIISIRKLLSALLKQTNGRENSWSYIKNK